MGCLTDGSEGGRGAIRRCARKPAAGFFVTVSTRGGQSEGSVSVAVDDSEMAVFDELMRYVSETMLSWPCPTGPCRLTFAVRLQTELTQALRLGPSFHVSTRTSPVGHHPAPCSTPSHGCASRNVPVNFVCRRAREDGSNAVRQTGAKLYVQWFRASRCVEYIYIRNSLSRQQSN